MRTRIIRHMLLALVWFMTIRASGPANGQDDPGTGSLRITAMSPTHGFFRPDAPMTAVITITNPHPRFTGVIEAWLGGRKTAGIVSQQINIGQGKFRFFLYPQPVDGYEDQLFVRVFDDRGKIRTDQTVPLRRMEGRWAIGALCGRGRTFTKGNLPGLKSSVLGIHSTELLPDRWYGYKLFDVLFWDGRAEGDLHPLQRSALTEWIQNGGRLILMAREGDTELLSPIPEIVPDLTLTPRVGRQVGSSTRRIIFSADQFPAPTGAYFAEKKYGLGTVVLLRSDFSELSSWDVKHVVDLLGYTSNLSNPRSRRGVTYENEGTLKAELARAAGYTELSFTPVLITVLIYLVLVSIVDYVVLKKLKRLPWTWATFPALIGVFSVFSFFAFYQGNLGKLERHELIFHDIGHEGRGRMLTMSCIRKSKTRPVVFDIEGSHYMAVLGGNDGYSRYGYNYAASKPRILESKLSLSTKKITIPGHVGSFQFFTEEWPHQSTEVPFVCKLNANGRLLEGSITRKIETPASHLFLIYRNRVYDVDDGMRISRRPTAIENIRESGDYRYYYREAEDFNLLESLVKWTKTGTANFIVCSSEYYAAEGRTTYAPRDSIYPHFLRDDRAILFAFLAEKSKYAGMDVNRIKCIRQIVDVVR